MTAFVVRDLDGEAVGVGAVEDQSGPTYLAMPMGTELAVWPITIWHNSLAYSLPTLRAADRVLTNRGYVIDPLYSAFERDSGGTLVKIIEVPADPRPKPAWWETAKAWLRGVQ